MALIHAVTTSGLLGDIGTFAGIAAAIGVAILSLVVLAQGREAAHLREVAESEADRAHAAEAALAAEIASASRVAREGQAPVAPIPAQPQAVPPIASAVVSPSPASVPASAAPGTAFEPAGMPALGSATPSPPVAAALIGTGASVRLESPGGEAQEIPGPAVAESTGSEPARESTGPAPIVIPPPSSVAAARTDSPAKVIGAPSTPAAGAAARSPRPPVATTSGKRRRSPLPAVLATVAVLAVAAAAVVWLGGSDSTRKGSSGGPATGNTTGASGNGAVVAVLNGTPVSGLAGQVAAELKRYGFKQGAVSTARDQQRQTTVVAYMPGHMTDAEAVARSLGVRTPVVPADDAAQSIACPNPSSCTAEVIVTVGADRTR